MRRAALAVAIAASCGDPALAEPRDDLEGAARAFDESVLRNNDDSSKPRRAMKWTKPIRIAVRNGGHAPGMVQPALQAVRRIAGEAGIEVSEVQAADAAVNFLIYFDENETPGLPRAPCAAFFRTDGAGISRVDLKINPRSTNLENCLIHEAMHAFGFASHPHAADSVLSYVYKRPTLTPLDVNLIKTLYDPAIKPGTSPQAASPLACELLARRMASSDGDRQVVCGARRVAMRTPSGESFEEKRATLQRKAGADGTCGKQIGYPVRLFADKLAFSYSDGWHNFSIDAAGTFAGSFTNEKNGNLYRLSGSAKAGSVRVENATLGCVWEGTLG